MNGVLLQADGGIAAFNSLEGNLIGTDKTGQSNVGNGGDGVRIDGASRTTVGGRDEAAAGTIAFNAGAGVRVVAGSGNAVLGNSIHSNGGLGLDLAPDGPTPNDRRDADGGPNTLQNAPVLGEVSATGNTLDLHGAVQSAPNTTFRVEFFASHVPDPSGFGEGETRIAWADLDTDGTGRTFFAITIAVPDLERRFITATATDPNDNTSEFSNVAHVDLPPGGSDTAGVALPASAAWFLRNANTPGPADLTFTYGQANPTWVAIDGDWDGDGDDTPGLYAPATATFFLKNSPGPGPADLVFTYGPAGVGWTPIAGDWNGDGRDTVGVYDPLASAFYLKDTHAPGPADLVFRFGPAGPAWVPVAGDWNGDDVDTVGLYGPASGTVFLKNTNTPGPADVTFGYGPAGLGWTALAGDYDADGVDTVGVYDPSSGVFFLRNTNSPGPADLVFDYGPDGATPLVGNWDGQ
jgi:hypothetical protein